MKYLSLYMLVLGTTILVGCESGPESSKGFSLPKGDVSNGKTVFLKYECLSCHKLKGIEQPDIMDNPELSVRLGGTSTVVKTYADLVTSIINPSHKIARGYPHSMVQIDGVSKMKVYNDVMTVTELVDVVTFLQPYYELVPHSKTDYRYYKYE
ncbi:c-type cytochrome [Moritella sp. Urea-trap-13]|uniref:c-type cytochrome n=1 Tax=Moritella sp. Urea-trap-13 TaxID=2058327 RepID=UPI000C344581|nr:c-type cytochrome [Moritella sp. Urea-trap-13]PKH08065.1 cytochrome C [Moritella sp. Urea-trap-13]